MDKLFLSILVILIMLIMYLIFMLYTRFKNDSINKKYNPKHKYINNGLPDNDSEEDINLEAKKNIILKIKQKSKIYKIKLELFDKELPLTCKNFRHMCFIGLKGKTYKNCKFNKIVKNGYLQIEDVFEKKHSLYGPNFKDESFKYTHQYPGVLSMVNNGPGTNNSEFFITTQSCPTFDGRNVVFGRVVSGLFNFFSLQHSKLDDNGKPLNDIEIVDISTI